MGQRAFKSIVKVRLRKEKEQEQLNNLSSIDLEFVAQFMTSSQRGTVPKMRIYNVKQF